MLTLVDYNTSIVQKRFESNSFLVHRYYKYHTPVIFSERHMWLGVKSIVADTGNKSGSWCVTDSSTISSEANGARARLLELR